MEKPDPAAHLKESLERREVEPLVCAIDERKGGRKGGHLNGKVLRKELREGGGWMR
jgi:hypothetical protein